jgi:hypothetical protein
MDGVDCRPPNSAEMATLFGGLDKPGEYVVLMKWYPGYMSAPHSYATDRLCLVLSGTWWVNSGSDFDPDATVPVPAGGFVRRVAHTPHYDGVRKGAKEPVIIGIFWYCASQFEIGRPRQAAVAVGLGVCKMTRIAMLGFALAVLVLAASAAKADEQPKDAIAMASQAASA